ncbi:ABC transporter permease [Paenibacillus sp. GCM10023248]|uniref:ABC transporter permease n=1 Tax=Bacillales TaxID=1385 RepID=UPI002378BA85|nr:MULTISPECIES: ABC-2 family transporter protein [Bacillales]MDD9265652.1 ABC-2 family transporter protein [Paenibacillus sp. MAHUQ-63]MDR6878892.1 ABC-2 type transport system permease protein [Bacillus sp. 3255]
MKYLRLFREFMRACLVEEFEYRANFAANVLSTVFWLAMAILTVQLYFYRTQEIGGWNFYEVLVLLGIFNAVHGFIEFILQPNMTRLVNHIRKGTLDFVLTKPVDSQFYVSFRHLVFWRLSDVVLGLGLVAYALWQMQAMPSLMELAQFAIVFLASLVVVYSLWMGMMMFSFWAVKVDNLSYLFSSFFETARFPVSVYKGFLRVMLTYMFPIAFITTFPASALIGRIHGWQVVLSVGIALVCFVLTRLLWRFALRHYTSASS